MKKIMISYPVLGNPVGESLSSIYECIVTATKSDLLCQLHMTKNESLIQRARNDHLHYFYNNTDCDYMISIDSDIELMDKTFQNNTIVKLVELCDNKDGISGGIYAKKTTEAIISASTPIDAGVPIPQDSIVDMRWLSTGCMCISRELVRELFVANKHLEYYRDSDGEKVCGLYNPIVKEIDGKRKLLSEDWTLCEHILKLGKKIYADTSIHLLHHGSAVYPCFLPKKDKVLKQVPSMSNDENKGLKII